MADRRSAEEIAREITGNTPHANCCLDPAIAKAIREARAEAWEQACKIACTKNENEACRLMRKKAEAERMGST